MLKVRHSMRGHLRRIVLLAGAAVIPAVIFPASLWAGRIKHPRALFTGLDKITGRTIAFEALAGETVQFGTLQITEWACFTRPATEAPQTVTFVEVDDVGAGKDYKRIFSGWMFAASPGLHGIEHPIYDIWLTDCQGEGILEAGLEAPANLPPAKAPQEARPAPPQLQRKERPHEMPQEPGGGSGEMPQEPDPEAALPPLGEPVEVGPPPGLIAGPHGIRQAPSRRTYSPGLDAAPDGAPEASDNGGY
jgi:hypothetical protein